MSPRRQSAAFRAPDLSTSPHYAARNSVDLQLVFIHKSLSLEGERGGEGGNLLILLHFRFSLGRVTVVPVWKLASMSHRTVFVAAVLLFTLIPLQAQEGKRTGADVDETTVSREEPQTAAKRPRRLQANPYSLQNRPIPPLNSPYSSRSRSLSIHRDERGRALGYSIRRPDGRTQYREFHGRGHRRSLGHAWQ